MKSGSEFVENVSCTSASRSQISSPILSESSSGNDRESSVTMSDVRKIVREQAHGELEKTNQSIRELEDLIRKFVSRQFVKQNQCDP